MVQRLPDPRLVTDGMAGGGIIVERYSMTAPGSDPVDKPSTIFPLTDIASMDQAAHAVIPVGTEKDRYHPGPPAQGTTWQPTATHGASYEGTSYSDQDGRLP